MPKRAYRAVLVKNVELSEALSRLSQWPTNRVLMG